MAETMASVKAQAYTDYQVLCIQPRTKEAVSDALNRTLQEASGEYVLLLRAGDTLFNVETLQVAARFLTCDDVYIGQAREYVSNGKGYTINPPFEYLSISYMCRYLPLPCSMFIRTELLRRQPLDGRYPCLMVWECVMRQWLNHTSVVRPLYLTIATANEPSEELKQRILDEFCITCDSLLPQWIQILNEKPEQKTMNRYQRDVIAAAMRKPMSRDWKIIRLSFFQLIRELFGKA